MKKIKGLQYLQEFLKRAIDLVIACLGLLILWPLFIIIVIVVKLDSPGKAFYHHQRIGKYGRPFEMYKFRSMLTNNNDAVYKNYLQSLIESENKPESSSLPYRKMDNDPRVTRVGRILRRFYLDEIPQLINVFKGDMSLVGPRPHVQLEVNHYNVEQFRRLSVRPGITGLWQIEGKADCSFSELIQLDLEYIDHWNLLLDLDILAKTFYSLVRGGEKFILQKKGGEKSEIVALHDVEPPLIQK